MLSTKVVIARQCCSQAILRCEWISLDRENRASRKFEACYNMFKVCHIFIAVKFLRLFIWKTARRGRHARQRELRNDDATSGNAKCANSSGFKI